MRDYRVNPIVSNDLISISTTQAIMVFAPGTNKIWDILALTVSCRGNLNQQMAGWALREINVSTGGTDIGTDATPALRVTPVYPGVAAFASGDGGIFVHAADGAVSAFSGTLGSWVGEQIDAHVQGVARFVPTNKDGVLVSANTSRLIALCLTSAPAAAITPVVSAIIRVRG